MVHVSRFADDQGKIDWLMTRTRAGGGLAPVDIERFWADQDKARVNPFGRDIPQCPTGIYMGGECVFDELGVPEDPWRYETDDPWRLELNRAYNDQAERIVGRRLLSETPRDPRRQYPPHKGLHDVFEARNVWHENSWWLMQSARNQDELKALLDRVQRRLENLQEFLLPDNWETEKRRLTALGLEPPLYRGQRGPVTFATSIYGVENLIFLILDSPPLAERLRDLILAAMLGIARVLDEQAGYTPATAPRGFGFCDDNCALLTPEMYEFFGYPILRGVFQRYSPDPGDRRGQHSDSAMGHLLPILGRLDFTDVNFGPRLRADDIRRCCRRAVILGQLAPFTFCRDEQEKIVGEFLRDFRLTRPERGLLFSTAGSINNGSRLTGMRLVMSAIQHFGRYDQ